MNSNSVYRYLKMVLSLKRDQEDEIDTYNEIKEGALFKGTNLWIMVMAMFISCIGLNINSKAAVIGAMIISPLMGPVFGIGFALGTADKNLLKLSFKNLGIIFSLCLVSSTLYYLLTPYQIPTDELLSFSKPTIFDILLAFFGGIAGFIAISRKEGSRVLVGVAVATACIPPLCTTSYGLATLQIDYIIGGMFTYLINCLFICLGTFIMVKYLRYKPKNNEELASASLYFSFLTILFFIPAIYWASSMIKENISKSKIEAYVHSKLESNYHLINSKYDHESKSLELDILNKVFDPNLEENIMKDLNANGIVDTKIKVFQSAEADLKDLRGEIKELKLEIQKLKEKN